MRFSKIYSANNVVVSFEFFPPAKESGMGSAFELISELSTLKPHFMTVTYRPDGTSRTRTRAMVSFMHNQLGMPSVAHLTCVGHSRAEIDDILDSLISEGVTKVLALRGDPPKDQPQFVPHPEGFRNARDLAKHICNRGGMSVAVAGYPEVHKEAASPESDVAFLREKIEAGAEVVLTQLFFDPDVFLKYRERCVKAGINVPIVPGIMPISSASQLGRFISMCGVAVPSNIVERMNQIGDDDTAAEAFGIEFTIGLCQKLLKEGVAGLHFYTLNKSNQIKPIVEGLGL